MGIAWLYLFSVEAKYQQGPQTGILVYVVWFTTAEDSYIFSSVLQLFLYNALHYCTSPYIECCVYWCLCIHSCICNLKSKSAVKVMIWAVAPRFNTLLKTNQVQNTVCWIRISSICQECVHKLEILTPVFCFYIHRNGHKTKNKDNKAEQM